MIDHMGKDEISKIQSTREIMEATMLSRGLRKHNDRLNNSKLTYYICEKNAISTFATSAGP